MSPTRALVGVITILGPLGATVSRGRSGQKGMVGVVRQGVVGVVSEKWWVGPERSDE